MQSSNRALGLGVPTFVGIAAGVLYVFANLAPYAWIGEYWGMMWMLTNAPLSMIVENAIGIGRDTWGLIAMVTAANGVIVALKKTPLLA